jgi:ABC-type glycerol-3-phosphate transport system permease component
MSSLIKKIIFFLSIGILAAINFFPIYWLVISSFRPLTEMITPKVTLFPNRFVLENYVYIFKNTNFIRYFVNSSLIALITTFLSIVISVPAGYSLARLKFYGRNTLGKLILFTYIIPSVLLIIPIFSMIVKLKLMDTYLSLIISYTTFSIPFCIWILRGFFLSIPKELEEASMVDGTGRVGALLRVIFPLSTPGVAAAAVFCFILSWNEYLFALVFINDDALRTLPIGLGFFLGQMQGELWGSLMAFAALTSFPVLIFFLLLEKYFVEGLTTGAVKG